MKLDTLLNPIKNNTNRHPRCKGIVLEYNDGEFEYDCSYNTSLDCDDCKYGIGRKDPEAKCNQLKYIK